jgi:sugar phosphate isomerase/epimerase
MRATRRELIRQVALSGALPLRRAASSEPKEKPAVCGLVIHSFMVRTGLDRSRPAAERFAEPHRFLSHARALGAMGIQVSLGRMDDAQAQVFRRQAEAAGTYVEGIVSLPREEADLERLGAELRTARLAGAGIVRTVMLSGRRYETFTSAAAFRRFAEQAPRALGLAAREAARQEIRLAVENHKDWRADELIAILRKHANDHVGVCLDTGNSIALLEDPMEVVEALAPLALTTHFKDMAVEPCREGFLLAEVPLGTGLLDLPRVVKILRAANPEIRFNLEMITRDPLLVPCLSPGYWETFRDLPAHVLARSLRLVRDHPTARPLPRISPLPAPEQMRAEDENVAQCLTFARERLGLALA